MPAVAIALSRPSVPCRPWVWPCQVNTRQAEVKLRDGEGLTQPLGIDPMARIPYLRLQVPEKKCFHVAEPHSLHLWHSEDGASRLGPPNWEAGRSALQAQGPLASFV